MESAVDLISNQKIDIGKPIVLPRAMAMLIEWKPKKEYRFRLVYLNTLEVEASKT